MANGEAASVLDASALLALLNGEDGAPMVREAMLLGAAISVANWVEVLSKAAEVGEDPRQLAEDRRDALTVEPLTEADCVEIARLRPLTMAQGLSIADRACLVLAARLGVPALTADRAWTRANAVGEVRLIR